MLEVGCIINNKLYFRCGCCKYDLGKEEDFIDWNYCPVCGWSLEKDERI